MLLEVTHENVFAYDSPISETWMEFRLTPLTDSSQYLLQHRARVQPPVPVRQHRDCWGNTVSCLNIVSQHERIVVTFDSVVETYDVQARGPGLNGESEEAPSARLLLHDFRSQTPLTAWGEEFLEFARPLERLRGAPPGELGGAVAAAIHETFRYEGEVTHAASPITDLLRERAGVCQDFAHLMLATCRYLGCAARYVSGYFVPEDPEKPTASHAWCELFDPRAGWLGIDPTHNRPAAEQYVRLGVGRDFRDVSPNRGVYRGKAKEELSVTVYVRPLLPERLAERALALYPPPPPAARGGRPNAKTRGRSILDMAVSAQQQQQGGRP